MADEEKKENARAGGGRTRGEGLDLSPFVEYFREHCGYVFAGTRERALLGGIETRMAALDMVDTNEYLAHLGRDEAEIYRLVNYLTVNETFFYRERKHFDLLARRIVPEVLRPRVAGGKVRILSAGCSSGEEPYSIAIALIEALGRRAARCIEIRAVDIDTGMIEQARRGVYGRSSFRDFPPELKRKYFTDLGAGSFEIKEIIKECVSFDRMNLNSRSYPDFVSGADVIFYRNVSIYFKPDSQVKIFKLLSDMLNEGGYIFVSSSETLSHNTGVLTLREVGGSFLYQKGQYPQGAAPPSHPAPGHPEGRGGGQASGPHFAPHFAGAAVSGRVSDDAPRGAAERPDFLAEILAHARSARYDEALASLDEHISREPGMLKAHALRAALLVKADRIEEALASCRTLMEMDRECFEAYVLYGIVAVRRGDQDLALGNFKKALHIRPFSWLPRYYRAGIYESHGDRRRALAEYGIVIDLLEGKDFSGHAETCFPVFFSPEQVLSSARRSREALLAATDPPGA